VKAVGRVAKPLKPATARDPGRHSQPCQIANKSKATPMSPLATEPAPSADPKATTQPSQATNGAFGFVQNAVNSLTSAPAKLLGWDELKLALHRRGGGRRRARPARRRPARRADERAPGGLRAQSLGRLTPKRLNGLLVTYGNRSH
jgi:hypothetical protein